MFGFLTMNLKNLLLKSKISVALLVFVQVFSVAIIIFSYGIINHYNTKVDEVEGTSLIYEFNRNKERDIFMNMQQTKKFFNEILPIVENKLEYFFVYGYYDEYKVLCSSGYKNGHYALSSQLIYKTGLKDGGEMFTEEEMASGAKCVIIADDMYDGSDCFIIEDEEYDIKGVMSNESYDVEFYVPYGAIPTSTQVIELSLILKKPLLESEYKVIANSLKNNMGDCVIIPEFEGVMNESDNRVYRDIMFVSVVLMFLFAMDYCIIYRYILEKRRKSFAISRICGGTRIEISFMYMLELLGASLLTYVLGAVVFHKVFLGLCVDWFEYIDIYCNVEAYKRLGMIYMLILGVVYLVLVTKFVRKTPAALIKEV